MGRYGTIALVTRTFLGLRPYTWFAVVANTAFSIVFFRLDPDFSTAALIAWGVVITLVASGEELWRDARRYRRRWLGERDVL